MEDGPSARQKLLVCTIWLSSAFFGVTTCFPDKVFGADLSAKIREEQLRTMLPPGTPTELLATEAAVAELTYCTVRTGVDDMLDYLAIVVALILPLALGPGFVAVFQVITSGPV
jgi:hypothetical protein